MEAPVTRRLHLPEPPPAHSCLSETGPPPANCQPSGLGCGHGIAERVDGVLAISSVLLVALTIIVSIVMCSRSGLGLRIRATATRQLDIAVYNGPGNRHLCWRTSERHWRA